MESNKDVTRIGGYIYGPRTRQGFLRMARLGIPRPPFALEDKIIRRLREGFKAKIKALMAEFAAEVKKVKQAQAGEVLVSDARRQPGDPGRGSGKEGLGRTALLDRDTINQVAAALQARWITEADEFAPEDVKAYLEDVLASDTSDFYKKFLKDAGVTLKGKMSAFSIDKRLVFTQEIADLMSEYIDQSRHRLDWYAYDLKQQFLEGLQDYVNGKSDRLDIKEAVDKLGHLGNVKARLFARDQMARFNKALTLSTYKAAGVRTVRWMTCNDSRVRASHRALNGKVFPIDALPSEMNDWNCRCGLIPVDYED